MSDRIRVTILGSTGSIGTQALDVIRRTPDRFQVVGLSAGGSQPDLLAQQAAEFDVPNVATGTEQTIALAAKHTDVLLNAVAGSQGLRATLAALDAGSTVALANKESLVAGGPLVTSRAKPGQIRPVDSEHSALAQCLRSGSADEVRKLVITASGGPFRGRSRTDLEHVTPEQALAHPTWDMGRLVTTNSATLVNKGLEVIEAHLLFGIPYDRIDVVVHPQSLIHSMVEFADGSTIAQVSPPDMRLPIAYALGWPDRVPEAAPAMDWTRAQQLTFEPLDDAAFPAVRLARRAGEEGGCAPAVYNAANEALVGAFHAGSIGFLQIVDTLADVVAEWLRLPHGASGQPSNVEDVEAADRWARDRALALI